jgi:hypothetical protein
MPDAPTTKTLREIVEIGTAFRSEADALRTVANNTVARFHRYIYVETSTPATPPEGGWTVEVPEPPPTLTYAWHQNVLSLYPEAQRAVLLEYYQQMLEIKTFFDTFFNTNEAVLTNMFDPTAKLDAVLAATLAGVIDG